MDYLFLKINFLKRSSNSIKQITLWIYYIIYVKKKKRFIHLGINY